MDEQAIPLVDLKAQYSRIGQHVTRRISGVLEEAAFILGPEVDRFEEDFARYCGTAYAIGLGSGTAALSEALLVMGIGQGDEVITVPNTFIATAEAISHVGAKPVLVDVDPESYNLDPLLLEQAISEKTRAIIPVHLYGQTADMGAILHVAKAYDLRVLEDACQAHGAEHRGRRAGSMGTMAAFSFYPGKNLGAYGDAGAVVTDSAELAGRVRLVRNHGSRKRYCHEVIGDNARMDGIQAAVLNVKLAYLDAWNDSRRRNAAVYCELLRALVSDGLVTAPMESRWARHVYHLFVVQVEERVRDALVQHLNSKGIGAQIHYPVPIHLQKAYNWLGYEEGAFPVAERLAKRIVSLPMFPELGESQMEYIVGEVDKFLRSQGGDSL